MIQNKFQRIAAVLSVGFIGLVLSGCTKTTHTVDGSLAEQIALDSAGVSKDKVSGLETNSSDSGFTVSFYDNSGKYIIGIDKEGKVDSYEFTKEEKSDQNQEKVQENTSVENNKTESDTPVSSSIQLPEGSLSKIELISRMAAFLGIYPYEESDFTLESANVDQAVMTVKLIDGRVFFTVLNPYTGEVLSSGNR